MNTFLLNVKQVIKKQEYLQAILISTVSVELVPRYPTKLQKILPAQTDTTFL